MKKLLKILITLSMVFVGTQFIGFAQSSVTVKSPISHPNLPMNIPPPPSFGSLTNKNGKYQIISAEYYSEDKKPFLYKRLIKLDTSTGEAWVLTSRIGTSGEQRKWIPLETK
jgi:hypothetical protein